MVFLQNLFNENFVLVVRFFLLSFCGLALQSCSTAPKNFPADIAIAAYGEINKENKIPATKKLLETKKTWQCLFEKSDINNPTSSADGSFDEKLKDILRTVKKQAEGESGDNEDSAEIKKAIQLIKTGQFFQDARSAIRVSSTDLFPEIKKSIISDIHQPKLLSCGITAPIKDIIDSETLFGNTLDCIYGSPTGKELGEAAKTLLENESVRLAIIAYARANGINLNESDLDTLRETALNTTDPDLKPLVKAGIARLKDEYGVNRVEMLVNKMENNRFDCNK